MHSWPWGYIGVDKGGDWPNCGTFCESLYNAVEGKNYRWTKGNEKDVRARIELTISRLNLSEIPQELFERFISEQFTEVFIQTERELRKNRKQSER